MKPIPGWRFLAPHEVIKAGDLYWYRKRHPFDSEPSDLTKCEILVGWTVSLFREVNCIGDVEELKVIRKTESSARIPNNKARTIPAPLP